MNPRTSLTVTIFILACGFVHADLGQQDFWDLPPISYSDTEPTDAIATLAGKMASGEIKLEGTTGTERLDFVLKTLNVSVDSQVLVFSKTSLQNGVITPLNPRCLYFSENAYVGYVPSGTMEVITQDPVLGPVYYMVDSGRKGGLKIERDTSNCLSCHATGRTEGVPGLLIRSVYPDKDGQAMLHLGTSDVTHETPLAERWGGWYVTGKSSMTHLGNRVYTEDGDILPKTSDLQDVSGLIDSSKYLRPTSDIVALMVLEHQCKMHSLFNAASLNYRRAYHFGKTINPSENPDDGSAGRVAESWAKKIVDYMFYKNEADLGEGVEGSAEFQKAFMAQFPKTADGDTLAEFRLYGRVFKNRCSYMIYSEAFKNLPPTIKTVILAKMKRVLAGEDNEIDWISGSERKRIRKILNETLNLNF